MALTLDLIRHGEAGQAASGGDEKRALTHRGSTEVRTLAETLFARGWKPERLFASPFARAQQTAKLLVRHGAPGLAIETLMALTPGSEPDDVLAELRAHGVTAGHVVLVSHNPLVGRLTSVLAEEPRAFSTGQLCRVEFAGALALGAGSLTLTLHPKV
jgi:phosphohistidine phosphatase